MQKRLSIFLELAVLGVLLIWLVDQCVPFLVSPMTANLRVLLTQNLDASTILILETNALHARWFRVDFTGYGQLYFNLGILASSAYSWLQPLTEGTIVFINRSISVLGAGLSVVLVYLFARRLLGPIEACLAAALLALVPDMVELAAEVHPDTVQMFLLTLSLYFCAEAVASTAPVQGAASNGSRRFAWLIFASAAAAGFAFSTKYVGAHLLPLIMLAAAMAPADAGRDPALKTAMRRVAIAAGVAVAPLLWLAVSVSAGTFTETFPEWQAMPADALDHVVVAIRGTAALAAMVCAATAIVYRLGAHSPRPLNWLIRSWLILATVVIFIAAFALGSPWGMYHLQFFPNLYGMAAYVNFGHGVKADWFGFGWLERLASAELVGPWVAALGVIGAAAIAVSLLKRTASRIDLAFALVLAWVVIYAAFLITRVNLYKGYYMLPLVPACILLAALGLATIRKLLTRWLGASIATVAAVAIGGMILADTFRQSTATLANYRDTELATSLSAENQALGDWFLRCVPTNTRVFPAPYSYTPPRIPFVWLTTQDYSALTAYKPDLVVLRETEIATYLGPVDNLATNLSGTTGDTVRFYDVVVRSGEWQRGPSFGPYRIYATPGLAAVLAKGAGCFQRP